MLLLHACPRCAGSLFHDVDGWHCLTCGYVDWAHRVSPNARQGACTKCGADAWTFRYWLAKGEFWLCARCAVRADAQYHTRSNSYPVIGA